MNKKELEQNISQQSDVCSVFQAMRAVGGMNECSSVILISSEISFEEFGAFMVEPGENAFEYMNFLVQNNQLQFNAERAMPLDAETPVRVVQLPPFMLMQELP